MKVKIWVQNRVSTDEIKFSHKSIVRVVMVKACKITLDGF